jgi:hypothetical protein
MAGLVEIAAPLKFLCCAREQMLHEQKLRLHESGLSRVVILQTRRSECPKKAFPRRQRPDF